MDKKQINFICEVSDCNISNSKVAECIECGRFLCLEHFKSDSCSESFDHRHITREDATKR